MANKKLEVNVQHIIKDIEAGKFTSFQSILNETGGQHVYEAVNEELRKYLNENNAVMISATQLAHLRETGYKDFESERKALEIQLKTATGDLKKQIEGKLKDLKKFQYYSERKAPIGDELHKILELTDKGLVDLNDAVKAANQIMQQMQIDPHTNEKLKSLVGKTSTDTMKNFRRAIKNAQDFQKMKVSAGMIGGETETARSMAFKKDGKLYVISGSTDWTKAKEGKIGDYKTTASFSAMHNLIQSVVNATLIRAQEGANLPITSKVAHLPITAGRMKYSNTLAGVYDINVGSYQEGTKLISDLIDVLEGKKTFTDVKIPGSVQGVAEKGPFTYKNEVREAMYYNGKPIGQWVGQSVEEVKSLLDSLQPQQRQQFLGGLFGQTDGKPWYNTENAKLLKEAFREMYQPTQKDFKTYGGMSLTTLSNKFASGEISEKNLVAAIKAGTKTQLDIEELAKKLFYGEDKYYSSAFINIIKDAIPDITRKITDIYEAELEKDRPGYLSGLNKEEKPQPSKYDMYMPDDWELEERKQQSWLEAGIERKKLGYTDKPLFDDKGVKTLADRMTRLVDFYQRTTNIFNKIAEDINKDLPTDIEPYTGEELARTYLARKSPEIYDRYMRSKGLYEGFTTQAQGLSLEEQVQWIRRQLDAFIAEEGDLLNTFDTFTKIADQESKEVFSKEFARKISYVGAPGGYIAPGTLYGLLMGSTFGVAQEGQMPEFNKLRGRDIYGRTLSTEAIDKLTENQADNDISKIDFYKQKLAEMAEELGVSVEKIEIFSHYLDRVQKVADQAGIELEQVLEGIDEQGFIKPKSLLDKQLKVINETPVESLYLPTSGKRGIGGEARESLFGLFGDTGINNLATQYDLYLNEQDNKRKEELKKQEDIRVQKEQEFTKLVDIELENRLKFLYAKTAKPDYIKAQEVAEQNEDMMGLTPEMFKGISEEKQRGLSIGDITKIPATTGIDSNEAKKETKKELTKNIEEEVKVKEQGIEQEKQIQEVQGVKIQAVKEEVQAIQQETEQIKGQGGIQDVRKRGKMDDSYDKWVVDRVVKNELGEVTDTIYKKARKTSGTRGPSGISQVVDKVIPAVENIDKNIDEINNKIPGSFKNIDWESFQKWAEGQEQDRVKGVPDSAETKDRKGSGDKKPKSSGKRGKSDEEKAKEAEEKAQAQAAREALKTEREYQQYLNQRLNILSKIETAQSKYNISIGKEREAAAGVVQVGNIELKYLDKRNDALIEAMARNQSARKAQMDYQQELKVATMQQQKLLGTKGAKSLWDVMANDIQRAAVRITDFGIAAKTLNKIPQDIQKIIQYTKELDAAMTNIRIVGGYTEEQAKDLIKNYATLGNQLSATTSEIAQGMNDWLRQGYEAEDQLEALVSASTKLSKLGMISASEATTALTSALKAFNLAAEDAIDVVDKLTKVDQKAAVSAGGIATALQKSATSAKLAGMSMDELIGSVSVIGEVTQQSMDTVGNAMKSILARYGNVKASVFTQMGLNDDGETSENINDIEKVLSKLGIRIRSSAGELRSITDVLDDVNEKWSTYDTVTKNAIATSFGGTRMRENFLVLIENWDRVKELTEESANAAGTADEKYEAYTDSIEAGLKRIQNAWENVSQKFEGSWLIKTGIGFMEKFISHLDTLTRLLTIFAATKFSDKIFTFGANTIKKAPNLLKKLTGLGVSSEGSVTYDEKGNMVVTPQETQRDFLIRKGTQTIVDTLNKNGVDTNTILNQIKILIEETSLGAKAQYDPNTGKIISGLSVNGRDVKYEGLDASGKRIFKYDSGGRITSKKRLADLNRQQDLIEEYNKNLGSPANPNQISGYVGQTWWGGAAKNVTIGGKTYTRSRVPKQIYGTKYAYVDEYGNDIKDISIDQSQQIDELNKKLQQQKKGARLKAGATAGITSALGALATTKQVGGGTIGKMITGSDISVEENFGDKAIRAGASGALAAVGGYFLGPLGAMLGQTIGEGAASIVSTIIHRSEIQLKQRVQDAKENLQALDSVKSAVESGSSIMASTIASSDDYAKLKEYTDNLTDTLYDYTSKYGNDILESINKGLKGSGVGDITTIADLCDKINNGNTEQRELIQRQIDIALAQKTLDETIESQAEERDSLAKEKAAFGSFLINKSAPTDADVSQYSKAQQELIDVANKEQKFLEEQGVKTSTVDSTGYITGLTADFSKYTSEELDALIKEVEGESNEALDGLIERLKEAKKQIEKNEAAFAKLDKELVEQRVNVGVLSADIYNLTQTDLKDLTMDGIMGRVVKTMEAQGVAVRDNAGYIKKEYKTAIEQAIKADSRFNALLENDTKTLGQLKAAQTKFNDYLKEHSDLVSKYGASWADWYSAIQRGEIADETIQKIVYAANPERIEQFARAWNTTAEELENLTNEFSDLTTALGLMTPSEVREYYSDLADIFTDLSDDTKITAENLEKIISKYPQLLKELSKEGKNATELSPELINKINREQLITYSNSLLNEELSSEGFFNDFAQEIKEKGAEDPKLLEYYNKYIGEVSNINELLDKTAQLRQSANKEDREAAEEIDKLVKEYMDFDMEIQWENPLYTKAKQAVIDRYSKEIEQLQEQKEALSQVNDERKKELDLIKAKDALENAKKEKVRVYRAGVGWTYEANEEAISQAQENLDNLDVQKRQEDIQYQIDQLEQIKNLIEGQDEEAQRKANEAALKSFFGDVPEKGLSGLFDSVIEGYKKNRVIINTATGKITDLEGNEIGKAGGLGKYGEGEDKGTGVLGGKQEAINAALSKIGDTKQKRWTSYEDSTNSSIMTKQEFARHKTEAAKYNNSYQNYLDAMQAKYSPGEVSENSGSLINAKIAYEKLQKLNNQGADKYSTEYISAAKNYEIAAKQLQSDIDEALAAGVSADNATIKEASGYIDWDLISGIDYKVAEVKALGKEKPEGLKGTWTSKTNLNVVLDPQANIYSDNSLKDFKNHPTYSAYMKYDPSSGKWGNWEIASESSGSSLDTLKKLPAYSIVANGYGDDEYGYIDENEQIRELSYAKDGVTTDFGGREASTKWDFAQGTESFQGGQALINELGTEAVITPSGTLTALPSKTGIVPADITKNVWALGEVAPTLVAQLNSLNQKPVAGNVGNTTYEEGQYFDHFTMNVYPAKGDDLDKILQQARAHVALTRHNN